jgi:hypothetical protein
MKRIQKQKYKIPSHVLAYIEGELKLYQTYLSRIKEIGEEKRAIEGQSRYISLIPSSGSDSDKLTIKTMRIAELDNEKIEVELRISKIEAGLNILPGECLKIIQNKYFWEKTLTNEQAIAECGYKDYRNRFYELLAEAQYKIGVVMGVIL